MARHALLTVLLLPDSERAAMIRQLGSNWQNGSAAELLIDCEEDRAEGGARRDAARDGPLRALVVDQRLRVGGGDSPVGSLLTTEIARDPARTRRMRWHTW